MSESFFQWNSKLVLNVTQMDDEHKVLVKIMNEIYQLNQDKKPFQNILSKIYELAHWTENHFKHEEAYFSSINYPKAEIHKQIHKDLLAKFTAHVTDIKALKKVPDSFFMFLKVWLSAHIMGIDAGYAVIGQNKAV